MSGKPTGTSWTATNRRTWSTCSGYSRGARTVRVLAGMLHKCGLLTRGSESLVPYMAAIYRRKDNDEIAAGFRRSFSRECRPHFIGVWDIVASIGWVKQKQALHKNEGFG